MRRRDFITLLGSAVIGSPLSVRAQQPAKLARIGFLGAASASGQKHAVEALRAGLHDLGYVEGKHYIIEFRWADGNYDRLPELAAELVRLNVDVLVTHAAPGTMAAKQATTTIPIVMAISGDAVASGLVSSIARPGGNVTGSTFLLPEITGKRLELLKEVLPRGKRVAVLLNPANPINQTLLQAMGPTAKSLKMELQQFEAREPTEFENAFSAMIKRHADAIVIIEDVVFLANTEQIARIATAKRLPSVGFTELAKADGLIAYGVNLPAIWRRAAIFLDKILKGARPADLPVELPTKFDITINLKTAKALGLTVPPTLLARADEVIE